MTTHRTITAHRARPAPRALAPLLLTAALVLAAAWPAPVRAVTPNRSVAAAALVDPRDGRPGLSLDATTWLEGEVEAVVSLTWWSAGRTTGRAAAGALEPGVGLRWALDRPGWRPEAEAVLGCRWRADPRGAASLGVALRAGLEWLPSRTVGLGLAAELRWAGGVPAALGLAAVGRLYF